MRINVILFLLFSSVLLGCKTIEPVVTIDCNKPLLTDVAECISNDLAKRVLPQEVEKQFSEWGYDGKVVSTNLIPTSPTAELIMTYRSNPQPYDPQGKLVVLEYKLNKWEVVFESPDPQIDFDFRDVNARNSLAGNWWFELSQVTNLTGDASEDILFLQRWSNITTTFITYPKLMTFIDGDLRILSVEDRFLDHEPSYIVDPPYIYSESRLDHRIAFTRTLVLENGQFIQVAHSVNPAAASLRVLLEDGTQFITFDDSNRRHQYGLYRIRGDEQFKYDTPSNISSLKKLRDGNVYTGGRDILRVEGDVLVSVIDEFAPIEAYDYPVIFDLAMTQDGELWAAGLLRLFRFGVEKSYAYDLITTKLTIAPDNTVWAVGWDGLADSNCCIFHVDGETVTTYQRDEQLPVSAELAEQIRAGIDLH